ncbi:hypothetical protein E2I00_005994 [Balaenoptera physalus]|uniref:Cytokine receptor-like factor 3 n=1 Tax=Balaenoptera physalus TaxID=9770 RepID=A0A643CI23_BALPH|nr:hypothetical protein E2I00_005994 [Balaenoptera physalus]
MNLISYMIQLKVAVALNYELFQGEENDAKIKESASQTRDVLKQHFNDLKGTLGKLLDERLVTLLQEVDTIEQETIKPLDDCQKLIEHGVNTAADLVQEGEIAILGGVGEQNEKLWSFTKKASHIQLDSLPEVPLLVDVPCLSAQLDDSILNIVKDHIFKHGTVASRPPVQIEELIEKPGGIIVRWCKVDDDFTAQDYRLQFRKCTSSHFEDAYVGSETEFIVLHIDPNVDYQFRVCARGDGRQEWSPWSVPQIGHSTLVPHGAVFVNGKEMTNQLPAVTSGSTVTFDIEAVTLGSSNNNEGGNIKLREC